MLSRLPLPPFIVVLLFILMSFVPADEFFSTRTGHVQFVSDAPLERIEAHNDQAIIVLNTADRKLSAELEINFFDGFKSNLQKEHFRGRYMESHQYPKASFEGKILENINFNEPGTYKVRAKGLLKIHNVSNERIISGTIEVRENDIEIQSDFDIELADYDIDIPKIVTQKISEIISINVKASLKPGKS